MKTIDTIFTKFLETPASPRPLAVFRICVSLLAIAQAAVLSNNILDLYGSQGLIQWTIGEGIITNGLPRISWVGNLLAPLGFSPESTVKLLFFVYTTSLFGVLLGFKTRFFAFIAWVTHFTLTNSGNLSAYGVETFTHIALFYFFVFPTGSVFSIDNWLGNTQSTPSVLANVSIRILQTHLCIVYLSTGLEKAMGEQWWNGEAIWRSLMQPQFMQFNLSWLAEFPWLVAFLGWTVLIIEIGYAVFIWIPKTRGLWVTLTIALHLGIGLFLGLWLFAFMMIFFTFSAFGWTIVEKKVNKLFLSINIHLLNFKRTGLRIE